MQAHEAVGMTGLADTVAVHSFLPSLSVASAFVLLLSALLLLLRQRSKGAAVNGFAHKAASKAGKPAKPADNRLRVAILFGTQTGTAERFSKQLRQELQSRYGEATRYDLIDIEDYDYEGKLASEKLVFLLMATYGDGEPTDNAADFYNWLLESAKEAETSGDQPLQGVSFSVFGLGNRQYEHFCAVGKRAFKALKALGGAPVAPVGTGDDDEDIDADFENWRNDLFDELDKSDAILKSENHGPVVFTPETVPAYVVEQLPADTPLAAPHAPGGSGTAPHQPFYATITASRELHLPGSERSCIHVELDVSCSQIRYEAGDHVGVYCQNSPAVVEQVAERLGWPLDAVFALRLPEGNPAQLSAPPPSPVSLREALACHADLLSPLHKTCLQYLAAFAADEAEAARLRHLATPAGKAEYQAYIGGAGRSLLEVLADFKSVKPSLGAFFGTIAPRLQPRFYSISSSPKAHPHSVHVTCAVVREVTATGRLHEGVCSTWLARLPVGTKVPVFTRRSTFKLPSNPAAPVIMVGPGTGFAPFRGFLQERMHALAQGAQLGPAVLFFGCRHRLHDFIYEDEMRAAEAAGAVTTLHTAFSRECADTKDYVQHHMERHADAVWAALSGAPLGFLYVCGDAKHMAKDVHRTLTAIVEKHKGCTEKEASAWLKTMADGGRYQKDVW